MSEEALVDHIFVRLDPQVHDYVEVQNPQNTVQLFEVLSKFEERYSCKAMRGSGNSDNVERRGLNERRMSNADDSRRNWRNSEVVRRPNNDRNDYRSNYENGHQGNQWFDSRNRFKKGDRRFNGRGYQFRNWRQKNDFSRRDRRNRGSSENFSRGDRMQRGRLNVLKVSDDQNDQTQLANEGITAQGAKCQNVGIVELNVRIREFEKHWLFHVLADLECPCTLGVDFMNESKIIFDFDRKSLVISEVQIDTVIKTIEEENVEIDLSKIRLEEKQNHELRDLLNSLKGLISDKPGLTHALYHEIDTRGKPQVVSHPHRCDRVKKAILDYHVEKMLKERTIIPIHSPYGSPAVLCRKNNGLPPVNLEAYRSTIGNLILLQSIPFIPYP
ncbi:uncharacterized protein TNCV_3828361 [Trichonephila clavipes]|nr:uncharacterized protein TNCV_3828361 [Trichonephila clavipes]